MLFLRQKQGKNKLPRLREDDSGVIYRMNKAGKTQTEIAEAIGFTQCSASKETKSNQGQRGYRFKQAQ